MRALPPFQRASSLLIGFILLSALVAGCVDSSEIDPDPDVDGGVDDKLNVDGRDLRLELQEDDQLDAPTWEVGQHFGVHVFIIDPDFSDEWHFDIIVVEDRGGAWHTATPNEAVAKEHAMWDYPGLGLINKGDLSFTGIGSEWNWMYQFPLYHEKEWSQKVRLFSFDGDFTDLDVTFTVTYAAAIETTDGDRPGFQIEGRTPDGDLFVEYDFVPAIGWFAHMWMYDAGEPVFHLMSMGFGKNWTGTYYVYEGERVMQHVQFMGGDPLGGGYNIQPDPLTSFEVADDATYLTGFIFAGAATGAQTLFLIDPDGAVRQTILVDDFEFVFFEEDAIPGEWRLVSVGAGMFAISAMQAWQLWKGEYTL